ncbi:MAG: Re/Si-specific NAD(P)(+) transhydrogenase subunit alpha [Planctomycetota bacterium]
MVQVFVPKETAERERRVALGPDSVKQLIATGAEVRIQAGAGEAAGFLDSAYENVGGKIETDLAKALGQADLVLRVQAPEDGSLGVTALKEGAALVTVVQPLGRLDLVLALMAKKATCWALELVPRISRAQKMDVLSSQASAGGYLAVLLAATALPRFFPMMMTAAGTITPARVLVMGAGVAGLQAIATAKRLGARVEATDVRPEVKEQVESLGGTFVDTGQLAGDGGYAGEAKEEFLERQQEILSEHVAAADVVITTALVPGRKAPILVTKDMVNRMKPGSVIVDMAAGQGGNCELSKPDERVIVHGVTIIGETNLPAMLASDASLMFGRNVAAFVKPLIQDGALTPDWDDEIVQGAAVLRDGEVVNAKVKEALEAPGGA